MAKIIFDKELMNLMTTFENITHAKVKDCIKDEFKEEPVLVYVVNPGQMGKAIGKKGANVARLEKVLNRKIKILEFNREIKAFITNVVYPYRLKDVLDESGVITLVPVDRRTRGYLIGRNAHNLRFYERIIQRYFNITELKVA